MRQFRVTGALTFGLTFIAACGITVRPHVRTGGGEQPPGIVPGDRMNPRPDSDVSSTVETTPVVDKVCRTNAMRTGWLAIRYLDEEENCPKSTDPENRYNAAVIERYSLKPVGATMTVCADQTIPRDWVREHNQEVGANCPGARVREGERTAVTIRRVAQRSDNR